MLRSLWLPIVSLSILAAQARAADADLQVTRVAIFSSGVAFFERAATVEGDTDAELSFRTDQINDILKSMIVQDLDGGTIGAVGYASQDPIEKALHSFGVDITGKPTLAQLLDQLRGEPVTISGEHAVAGVILGVEKQRRIVDRNVIEQDVLNILGEGGIEQVHLSELRGIQLSNSKIDGELRRALATLALSRDADKKSVSLRFNGKGRRRVRVAYLLEAPIWKTSYRLSLDEEGVPFLQGWATVENATEQDWRDVRLSLVSGRPISFTMDLYTPLYVPRPREELELYASLRPPTYEGAIGGEKAENAALGGRPRTAVARRAGVAGGRLAAKSIRRLQGLGYTSSADEDQDDKDAAYLGTRLEDAGVASVAQAQQAGELFEYNIRTPVSIPRRHSAMLPIVNEKIKGEKVSIYNPAVHARYPLNGLKITNATDLHLMQGPVTVFDSDVYAGDAKLPDLRPGEDRLIAYALDLGTEVVVQQKSTPAQTLALRIIKGTLIQSNKLADERTYAIKNKSDARKTILVEQPYSDDWKLIEPEKPAERTASLSRFRVEVEPRKSAELRVALERTLDQTVVLSNLPLDRIRIYIRSRVIKPEVRAALEQLIVLRSALDSVSRERQQAERAQKEAVNEQARIRENLKTLRSGTDSHRRQLEKFDRVETRIEQARESIGKLRKQEETRRRTLESYLLTLNVG